MMCKLILSSCIIISISTIMAAEDSSVLAPQTTNRESGGLPVFELDPQATNAGFCRLPVFEAVDADAPCNVEQLPEELARCVKSFEINGVVTLTLTQEQYDRFSNIINQNEYITVNIISSPRTAQEAPQNSVRPDFNVPSYESLPASPARREAPELPSRQKNTHVDPNA